MYINLFYDRSGQVAWNILKAAICILLLCCSSFSLAQATTFYVSAANGKDTNTGGQSLPFKTIQRAIDALTPGDDVLIGAGLYAESPQLRNMSGTAANYIEIAAQNGANVSIEALNDPEDPDAAFLIEDSNFIRLKGIRINGSRRHGIGVFDSNHIKLLNNVTYNTGKSGIRARYVNDILLDGNDVSRAVQREIQESVSLSNVDGFVISNNYVHDRPRDDSLQQEGGVGRGGEGIDVKDGSRNGKIHDNQVEGIEGKFGIYVDAYDVDSYDIEIFNNVVTGCGCGFAFSTENGTSTSGYLRQVKMYNNISYGNRCGIYFGNHGGDASRPDQVRRVEDIAIVNNTIYGNGIGVGGGGIDIGNPHLVGLTIRNNLIFENQGGQIRLTGGLTAVPPRTVIESNLVRGNTGSNPAGNNLQGNPGVQNASGGDFRLTTGSAAIDAGQLTGTPAVDQRGIERPQGAGIDIGAFEFESNATTPVDNISPNPPTDLIFY